jgi:hypothetical protein
VAKEIREMREIVGEVIHLTTTNELNPGAKRHLTEIVQLLQSYARLAELELAAGGSPTEAPSPCLPTCPNLSGSSSRLRSHGKPRMR